jgi:hypothetical protein
MTENEAIELMETAVDIHDWNQKRQLVKYNLDKHEHIGNVLMKIDSQGLVTEVAKKNNWPTKKAKHD